MADKPSSPAFSMGNHRDKSQARQNNTTPGPGSYEPHSFIKDAKGTSGIKNSEKRFQNYQTLVPGPGTYSKEYNSHHAPNALVLSRCKQQKVQSVPGPGAYDPKFKVTLKSENGYKISQGEKLSDITLHSKGLPGPGQYEVITKIDMEHSSKFGNEKRSNLASNNQTPGPGCYEQAKIEEILLKKAPKVIFGKSGRSMSDLKLTPGPGTYKISDHLFENKGFIISLRREEKKLEERPGPGTYNVDELDKLKHKIVSYSLTKTPKLLIDNEKELLKIPGPQKYEYNTSTFDSRAIVIGKQKRKSLAEDSIVPGPGAYTIKLTNTLPQFSMPKSNSSWIIGTKNPGPGTYEPKMLASSQYSRVGINKDDRKPFYDEKKGIPGPGQYEGRKDDSNKQGFTIGHSKREENNSKVVPGPGKYTIPSTIGNVPKYSH